MSGFSPESSAIRMTPELAEKVSAATSAEEIKTIMAAAALEQHLVERDALNPEVLHETPAGTAPRGFAKTLNINGQKHVIESDSELGLAREENALYRKLFESTEDTTTREQARDSNGRFVSQSDAEAEQAEQVRLANLEQAFKLGQIDTQTYLIESGALDRALVQKEVQEKEFVRSWADATEEFLHSPEGSYWEGGEANLKTMGNILIQMDAEPSIENLVKAYQYMKEHNLVQPNPELEKANQIREQERRISEARTPEELKEILGYRGLPTESGMWGL